MLEYEADEDVIEGPWRERQIKNVAVTERDVGDAGHVHCSSGFSERRL